MTRPNASELLASHRSEFETMISMNAATNGDSVTRYILDGLDRQARKFLREIDRAERDLARAPDFFAPLILGEFGENQYAPTIRDICRSAELHRAMATRTRIAA